jgi:hypothetical protein
VRGSCGGGAGDPIERGWREDRENRERRRKGVRESTEREGGTGDPTWHGGKLRRRRRRSDRERAEGRERTERETAERSERECREKEEPGPHVAESSAPRILTPSSLPRQRHRCSHIYQGLQPWRHDSQRRCRSSGSKTKNTSLRRPNVNFLKKEPKYKKYRYLLRTRI